MKILPKKSDSQKGFTLVEVMIAIGLFTVIMTIGIGAILGVNSTHRKTQSMRAVIDNLSFLMEDMTRSIRLGDYFYCDTSTVAPTEIQIATGNTQHVLSDQNCKSLVFEPFWDYQPAYSPNQVMYFIREDNSGRGTIFKKESESGWNEPLIAVTPVEIDIDVEKSGFTVVGAEGSDLTQPRVTIVLVGTVLLSGVETEFNMQTTVSQRLLDVDALD